jgi:hypothetical protein
MKTLTNSEILPKAASESESQAASCMPQQTIWRGLQEEFTQLVSVFLEAS